LIQARWPDLDDTRLGIKADGLASAVRSAIGYWQTATPTLNAKVLTRYYALLQVSIAEQVSSSDPAEDLNSVQRHTEQGHGFAALQSVDGEFPHNYYVACMQSGHFPAYLAARGLGVSTIAFERRPRSWEKLGPADRAKLISLSDLLLRVPEVQGIAEECLGRSALSFQVGHANKNHEEFSFGARPKPAVGERKITYGALYVDPDKVSVDQLNSLGLPFKNFEIETDKPSDTRYYVGELEHPAADLWWDHFPHHKSDYCGTATIAPFWGITDVFALHLATMYALSIVVRYLPSIWHRVEYGDLDHVRALIEHYLSVLDNIGPALAVERITGTKVIVATPGSLTAPI